MFDERKSQGRSSQASAASSLPKASNRIFPYFCSFASASALKNSS
jgi:hypothetical protein